MTKLFFLFLFFPAIIFCQNSAYVGVGIISSFANTTILDQEYSSENLSDIGLYYGNKLVFNDYLETIIEVSYLNNRVVLAQEENNRFELHQNIGFALKPGVYLKKHSIHLNIGIFGVYLFDKDEKLGGQLDRFDESYFYGLDYSYNLNQKISANVAYLFSEFESVSNWTQHTLKDFSILQLSILYRLY
ncbi:MAG: hypothetical protein ACON4Y_00580 [Flavobacteriales bacterium]